MLVDSRLRLYAKDSDQGCNSGKNQISILPPFNIEDYLPFYTDKFIIIFFFHFVLFILLFLFSVIVSYLMYTDYTFLLFL